MNPNLAKVYLKSQENEQKGLFEGCGQEGPINAIFLSEFHHIAGPQIVYQYPSDAISKDIFDAVSTYIIPKTHLQRLTVTVNTLGTKIIGYPIRIMNDKYERTAFYFNTCFVCDSWAKTAQYEKVLIKLAEFFHNLEIEVEFLSKQLGSKEDAIKNECMEELERFFSSIMTGLNGHSRHCSFVFRDRLLSLKVVPSGTIDAPAIANHQVPVFIVDVEPISEWDLTTQQVIPYVDGFNHVVQISQLADVDLGLVQTCLQNLLCYKVIKMIPTFQYSNMYCVTPELHSKLIEGDPMFRNECLYFVARTEHCLPNFADILRFYCSMKRGVAMKELCIRLSKITASPTTLVFNMDFRKCSLSKYSDYSLSSSTHSRNSSNPSTPIKLSAKPMSESQSIFNVIDEQRLVLFGLIHNMIRRIEKYPILQQCVQRNAYSFGGTLGEHSFDAENREYWTKKRKKFTNLYTMFDGKHTYDEICLAHELSQAELDDIIDRDPDVVVIWK